MTASAVTARGLVVARRKVEVLHGLTFALTPGRVTGLLGPSGCGKTTLIRSVVGTQRIQTGELLVLGRPAGSAELRGKIGYSSQSASVYPDLTVSENIAYFARVLRAPPGDDERVLAEVDMAREARRLTGELSGGERSRVSLAIALLGNPQLLVLDEPTVGLDPVLRQELWALFAALTAGGRTLLVSSHVMDEAARCNELLLMRDGRLLAQETPAALTARTGTADLDAAFLQLIADTGGPR